MPLRTMRVRSRGATGNACEAAIRARGYGTTPDRPPRTYAAAVSGTCRTVGRCPVLAAHMQADVSVFIVPIWCYRSANGRHRSRRLQAPQGLREQFDEFRPGSPRSSPDVGTTIIAAPFDYVAVGALRAVPAVDVRSRRRKARRHGFVGFWSSTGATKVGPSMDGASRGPVRGVPVRGTG